MSQGVPPFHIALLAIADCASKREQRRRGADIDFLVGSKRAAGAHILDRLTRLSTLVAGGWPTFLADVEVHLSFARFQEDAAHLGGLLNAVAHLLVSLDEFAAFHVFLLRTTERLARVGAPRSERGSALNLFARGIATRVKELSFGQLQLCFETFRRFVTDTSIEGDLPRLLQHNHFHLLEHYLKEGAEHNVEFDLSVARAHISALAVKPFFRLALACFFSSPIGAYLETLQPGRVAGWLAAGRFHAFIDPTIGLFFPGETKGQIQKAAVLAGVSKLRSGNRADAVASFVDAIRCGQNNKDEETIGLGLALLGATHGAELECEEQRSAIESFYALSVQEISPVLLLCVVRQQLEREAIGLTECEGRTRPPLPPLLARSLHLWSVDGFFHRRRRAEVQSWPFTEHWNTLHLDLLCSFGEVFALTRAFFTAFVSFGGAPSVRKTRGVFALAGLLAEEDVTECARVMAESQSLLRHNGPVAAWEWRLLRLRLLRRFGCPTASAEGELQRLAPTRAERLRVFQLGVDALPWECEPPPQDYTDAGFRSLELSVKTRGVEALRAQNDAKSALIAAIEHAPQARELSAVDCYVRLRVVEAWGLAEAGHLSEASEALSGVGQLVDQVRKTTKASYYFECATLHVRRCGGVSCEPCFASLRLALRYATDVLDFSRVLGCLYLAAEVLHAKDHRAQAEAAAHSFVTVTRLQAEAARAFTRCGDDAIAALAICADTHHLLKAVTVGAL